MDSGQYFRIKDIFNMHLPPPPAPFFSIVIPLYNAGKVFSECLNSIVSQSFSDFEAIIVDDGSTDGSRKIAEGFRDKDCRLKIIVQENQGALIARKNGVEAAKRKFLILVDADDLLAPGALQIIHDNLIKQDGDILQYSISRFMDGEELDKTAITTGICYKPDRNDILEMLISYRIPSLCTKAIRREVYLSVPLPTRRVNIGEDYLTVFHMITMNDVRWAVLDTNKPLYLYRQYPSTQISRKRLEELSTFDDVCYIRSVMLKYFQREKIEDAIMTQFCENFIVAILENIFYMAKADKGLNDLKNEYLKLAESDVYKFVNGRKGLLNESGIKWKLEYFMLRKGMIRTLYLLNKVFTYFC